jgi:predicted transcriptional regulator
MLKELFGSQTTEKVLLYLVAQSQGYSSEIAAAFAISNTQVLRTLNKLEEADIIVGQSKGRTRIFLLNRKWYLAKELEGLLKKALLQIPLDQQQQYFGKRQKARKKSKPL